MSGDRRSVEHVVDKMGHPNDPGDGTKAVDKTTHQPISDIISKFQKIKEEKFKEKFKNKVKPSIFHTETRKDDENNIHVSENTSIDVTVSKAPIRRRKMSLPSIYHPIAPLTPKHGSTESVEKVPEERPFVYSRRRHSISHVVTEYSKHDLEHLSKIYELKLKELNAENEDDQPEVKDEEPPRWLTGEDLHAFYNMWDHPDKQHDFHHKHQHTVEAGKHVDKKDDIEPFGRPRLFSL